MLLPRKLTILFLALLAFGHLPVAQAQDSWNYELIPFLWASGLDGTEGISGNTVDVDASFGDLIEFVNVGASLRFSAHRESIGWFAEVAYVELGEDDLGPFGNTEITVTQTLAEAGLSYDLSPNFSVYGGLRYQDLDNELEIGNLDFDDSQGWVDAMVGVKWTPVISDHWLAWVRSDIGGGGSDLTWMAEAGAGYSWQEAYAVYLAYRLLDTDYEDDGFLYDMRQSGFALGFGFRF